MNQQENWTPAKLAEKGVYIRPWIGHGGVYCRIETIKDGKWKALSNEEFFDHQRLAAEATRIAKEREGVKVYELTLSNGKPIEVDPAQPGNCPDPCFQLIHSRIVGETPEERLRVMYRASLGHELTSDEYSVLQAWHLELRKANAAIAAARKEGE